MGRVAGVLDDPPGFPCTPPGVDVLEGGKLTSNNVAGSSHDPLQSFAVSSGAVSKPGGDAAGQDALHSHYMFISFKFAHPWPRPSLWRATIIILKSSESPLP